MFYVMSKHELVLTQIPMAIWIHRYFYNKAAWYCLMVQIVADLIWNPTELR